jgi:hypothetical protein
MEKAPAQPSPKRSTKIVVAAGVALVLIAAIVFLVTGRADGLAYQAGFLGMRCSFFADINLAAEMALLAGLLVGAIFARAGHISTHQYNQTSWVLFNSILVAFIMVVSFNQNVAPHMPGILGTAFGLLPALHAVAGTVAIVCGFYLILRMNALLPKKWRIKWWKKLMRFTLAMYALVGAGGLLIYYVWYIL